MFCSLRDNISSVCHFEYKTEDVFVFLSRKLHAARLRALKVCAVAGVWFIPPVKSRSSPHGVSTAPNEPPLTVKRSGKCRYLLLLLIKLAVDNQNADMQHIHLADAFIQSDLQLYSGYTFFISMCSLGIEPTTFCAADAMRYHWATHEHIIVDIDNATLNVVYI